MCQVFPQYSLQSSLILSGLLVPCPRKPALGASMIRRFPIRFVLISKGTILDIAVSSHSIDSFIRGLRDEGKIELIAFRESLSDAQHAELVHKLQKNNIIVIQVIAFCSSFCFLYFFFVIRADCHSRFHLPKLKGLEKNVFEYFKSVQSIEPWNYFDDEKSFGKCIGLIQSLALSELVGGGGTYFHIVPK